MDKGSHFIKKRKTSVNDEWATSKEAWSDLVPILESFKGKCVWMPFYYDGACARHLKELGFKHVVHQDQDFFEKVKDKEFLKSVDWIWDNPPYSGQEIKERILQEMFALGKPFVLLLPSAILFSNLLRECIAKQAEKNNSSTESEFAKIQVIYPRKVMVSKTGQNPVPFKYLVWLCYNIQLSRDLILL
jgi:hypothetical protein